MKSNKLCQNCGKNEATIHYTKIENGIKHEIILCEECANELGIEDINFNMPIDFSSYFGDFFENLINDSYFPIVQEIQELKCNQCGLTFDEFIKTGKFGCSNCYETFHEKIDPILKNIHGSNRHIGRLGEIKKENIQTENKQESELLNLKKELKQLIKEEKYEEAAIIRDKIKEMEKNQEV